jgi:hypothetical protein
VTNPKVVGIVKDYHFVINTGLIPGGMVVLYVFSQSKYDCRKISGA